MSIPRVRRALLSLALLLGLAAPGAAQVQGGTITGTIRDQQGAVLPGVEVTLTGPAETSTYTTGPDGQFRFLNVAPGTYQITANLSGFARLVRENIAVTVGQTVTLPVTMSVASVQEEVTVSGASPIVDVRKVGTSTNFTQDELTKIPNSRDPWALLRTVPGIIVDRVNIAGNETGQNQERGDQRHHDGDAAAQRGQPALERRLRSFDASQEIRQLAHRAARAGTQDFDEAAAA